MQRHHEALSDLREPTRLLRHAIPGPWAALLSLHDSAMADGELPMAVKEAAALAMSVVKRCDGCISHHARAAARAGASQQVVAEMLAVALLMDGATATVYGPRAWEAFLEFQADAYVQAAS